MHLQQASPVLRHAPAIPDLVGRDREEPHAQRRRLSSDAPVEQTDEGLLGHILRDIGIAGEPLAVPEERRKDLVVERVEVHAGS